MPPWEVEPTAKHFVALTHDTELSVLPTKPLPALGLDTIVHAVPFHTIANVVSWVIMPVYPTATQYDALTHDTDVNLSVVPALGLDTLDHDEPFHTIANVVPENGVPLYPTATQYDALTHDTDSSSFEPLFGLDMVDHSVPFHAIANVVLS